MISNIVYFPSDIKSFMANHPGELIVKAEALEDFTNFEADNNGFITSERLKLHKFFNAGHSDGTIYAYKNRGGPKAKITQPAWNQYTLVEAFPAYGRFLGNILVFSNFLRSFAGTILEEI